MSQRVIDKLSIRFPGAALDEIPAAVCLKALNNRLNGVHIDQVRPTETDSVQNATYDLYEAAGHEVRVLQCWRACGAFGELEITDDNVYLVHGVSPAARSTEQCMQGV